MASLWNLGLGIFYRHPAGRHACCWIVWPPARPDRCHRHCNRIGHLNSNPNTLADSDLNSNANSNRYRDSNSHTPTHPYSLTHRIQSDYHRLLSRRAAT